MKTLPLDFASRKLPPRVAWQPLVNFRSAALCGLAVLIGLALLAGVTYAAAPAQNREVNVFGAADESSAVIETVRDGSSLAPIAEMTGAGGLKWFMVKTKSGNVGWIKAGDNAEAKRIDDHFRALPKESVAIRPAVAPAGAGDEPATSASTSENGVITVPVKINGNKVSVPVTFKNGNSSTTGSLAVDTGADQTIISKRMARELRIQSIGRGISAGIGGTATTEYANIETMTVGKVVVKNMRVSILDFTKDARYEGLLGFDFLGRYQMSLDSEKQVMVLTPRKK